MSPSRKRGVVPDPAGRATPLVSPWGALGVAVLAMSWAGPLVRFATAPALAIAAWRLVFAMAVVGGVLAYRGSVLRGVRLTTREWFLGGASGLFLAAHFWTWIASVQLTTVASSVVLVSTQPFFIAGLSVVFLGERPTSREWTGIVVAVVGAAVIGWGDFGLGPEALAGDALALLAAVLVAAYYTIGRRLRQKLDLWAYVAVVYGVAALTLLGGVVILPGVPLTGYPAGDWLVFVGLAVGPMMLGHTGVNYAIRYIPPYVANLVILGEPVGATLIAWALPALREVPPVQTFAGGALILLGIAVSVHRPAAGETWGEAPP